MFSLVLTLLSGVAMFLFGMQLMGDGLKKVAGKSLELTLYKLTSTPIKGVLLGAGVTAVIQSSSATSVMVVGFVNSGMMKVAQAIGIIMGANIGTSITGWILCLSYLDSDASGIAQILSTATLSAVVAVIGILLKMLSKHSSTKSVGDIMMGFAILMVGMQTMSGAVSPLKSSPTFVNALTMFSNPVMGIIAGILFTAVLQSASASVGILQALSVTGGITFATAFPITLGIGIGAACPVLLSSIGTSKNGKRTALIYLLNDLFGMIFWSIVFYSVNAFAHFGFMDMQMTPVTIALLNTVYRTATIIVLLPFIKYIEKLTFILVKDSAEDKEESADFDLLEERFLNYPDLAIQQSHQAMQGMFTKVKKNYTQALGLMDEFSQETFNRIQERENQIDKYEDKVGDYLMKMTKTSLNTAQSTTISQQLHCLSDIERIGDHASHLSQNAAEIDEKKLDFSDHALGELDELFGAVTEILDNTYKAFCDNDMEAASNVEPLRTLIAGMCDIMKMNHIVRLRDGDCVMNHSFVFNDILTNAERIAAHCSNVGIAMLETKTKSYDPHEYQKMMLDLRNEDYHSKLEALQKKYSVAELPSRKKKKKDKEKDSAKNGKKKK